MSEHIEIQSHRLRPEMRRCLNNVRIGGTVAVTRYNDVEAVMVSPAWYEKACKALMNAEINGDDL